MPKDPPSDVRTRFALEGEARAEAELRRAGMRILARRYRTRHGEIDLVAEDREILVFAEVKARRTTRHGTPGEAVGARKQSRIASTALAYLAEHRLLHRVCRFDVVEVLDEPGCEVTVRHIPDAFRLEPRRGRR